MRFQKMYLTVIIKVARRNLYRFLDILTKFHIFSKMILETNWNLQNTKNLQNYMNTLPIEEWKEYKPLFYYENYNCGL